jgi:hypothetical protein
MANPGSDVDKDTKQQHAPEAGKQDRSATTFDASSTESERGGVERMMGNAMSTTGRVGSGMVGGVTNVATDLVHGVGTIGGEVVTVVRDTANSAIAGVGSIGETAVHTVTGLLADLIGGIRDIGTSAVRGRSQFNLDRDDHAQETRRHREEAMH